MLTEEVHAYGVLMEEVRDQHTAVLEAVGDMRKEWVSIAVCRCPPVSIRVGATLGGKCPGNVLGKAGRHESVQIFV